MASSKEDMFPVRVIIETVQPQHCLSCAHDGHEILDTFVIISGHTMVGQLVGNILSALGFPQYISISRGLVQINNWKPLPLETITDNQEELVSKLFKEVSTSISFRILIKQSSTVDTQSSSCITDLKQRLLKVAIEKQPSILTSVDNQELKQVIQQLISGNEESSSAVTNEHITAINEWLNQLSHESSNVRTSSLHSIRFHQVFELPRMEKWFNSDANPSRQKLINYVNVLNTLPSRRTSNKVTYQQLCNWFANKRAIARMRANGEAVNIPLTQKSVENGGADLTTSLSSLLSTITSSSNQEALTTTTVTDNNNDGSSNNNNNSCDTNAGGICADVAITTTGQIIPLATTPIDIRSKFINTPSSNNDYVLTTLDGERMDGGSESPNGNDDASVNSVNSPSDTNYEADMKESGASSPTGMLLDSNHAISPQPPSSNNGMLNNSNGGSLGGFSLSPSTLLASQMSSAQNHHLVTAATQNNNNNSQSSLMAAFSSLMPSLMNSHMGSAFLNVAAAANNNNNNHHQSVPVCSSPMSSSSSMNNFGGNSLLKSTSGGCKEETGAKTDSSSVNNNNQNGGGAARSRLMFDPLSELPILESWFEENPHPGCFQIEQFTERLNSFPYRQNYPPISTHNVKIWFKNRRAKCKRLNLSDMSSKMALSAN